MARDPGKDWITWRRPVSARDALVQFYSNLLIGLMLCFLHIGTFFYDGIVRPVRNSLGLPESQFLKKQRIAIGRKREAVIPLANRRRRALTLPLPVGGNGGESPWDTKQRTIRQTDSKFYSKLPFEVRCLIFEYAMAGDENVFHIFKRGKHVGNWKCQKSVDRLPCTWVDPCSKALPFKAMSLDEHGVFVSGDPTQQRYFDRSQIELTKKEGGILSLLLTCRQTYTETITMLYSKLHFHFPGLTDILDFSRNILPYRFDAIRVLSVDWEPNPFFISSNPQMRVAAWDTISQMKGLQELRVYVKTLCIMPDTSATRSLRHNMAKVKGLNVFELHITADQIPSWKDYLGAEMKVTIVANPQTIGIGYVPNSARLMRAY